MQWKYLVQKTGNSVASSLCTKNCFEEHFIFCSSQTSKYKNQLVFCAYFFLLCRFFCARYRLLGADLRSWQSMKREKRVRILVNIGLVNDESQMSSLSERGKQGKWTNAHWGKRPQSSCGSKWVKKISLRNLLMSADILKKLLCSKPYC